MKKAQFLAAAALLAAISLPLLPIRESWVTTFSYIGIYSIVTIGVVLMTGMAGLLSFGQSAFVGLGAYASAVLGLYFGITPWVGLLAGWVVTLISAWVLGRVTLTMSGPYLPITTMAWGLAIYFTFTNIEALGRNDGLNGLPPITLPGVSFEGRTAMYYMILVVLALAVIGTRNFLNSRLGRATRALKAGTTMPEAMGIDTLRVKTLVFVIAALLASTAGWLYAHMVRAISPSAFGFNYGVEYVFMAVVGGASYLWGALAGAAILTIMKDVLQSCVPRVLPLSGNFESIFFGALMLFVLIRTKDGLWSFVERRWPSPPAARIPDHAEALPERPKPAPGEMVLELRDVSKRFGGLLAVNKVSFEVQAGSIFGLIGPNGAGKSTTFNLITGVLDPTGGEVFYRGESLRGLSSRQIAARGVSRTFQHVHLLATMSVLENVALGAHLRCKGNPANGAVASSLRLNRSEEDSILKEAAHQLQRVGLSEFAHAPAGSLSLGQQRLVEIARALCSNPALLLLDEPAAGLRYLEKRALGALLRQLQREGLTVLLVEHDMEFVMELTEHIVVMDFGTRIAQGTPEQIQQDPAVLDAYLGAFEPEEVAA